MSKKMEGAELLRVGGSVPDKAFSPSKKYELFQWDSRL